MLHRRMLSDMGLLSRHENVLRMHHRLTTSPLFGKVPGFGRAHVTVLHTRALGSLGNVLSRVRTAFNGRWSLPVFLVRPFGSQEGGPTLVRRHNRLVSRRDNGGSCRQVGRMIHLGVRYNATRRRVRQRRGVNRFPIRAPNRGRRGHESSRV